MDCTRVVFALFSWLVLAGVLLLRSLTFVVDPVLLPILDGVEVLVFAPDLAGSCTLLPVLVLVLSFLSEFWLRFTVLRVVLAPWLTLLLLPLSATRVGRALALSSETEGLYILTELLLTVERLGLSVRIIHRSYSHGSSRSSLNILPAGTRNIGHIVVDIHVIDDYCCMVNAVYTRPWHIVMVHPMAGEMSVWHKNPMVNRYIH